MADGSIGKAQTRHEPTARKTVMKWHVPEHAPLRPDDLTFFGRDQAGHAKWWVVTPADTDYWHVHQMLGRAYAFELLDLMNNPAAEYPKHILTFIVMDQLRSVPDGSRGCGVVHGFHEVLSEMLSTGAAAR